MRPAFPELSRGATYCRWLPPGASISPEGSAAAHILGCSKPRRRSSAQRGRCLTPCIVGAHPPMMRIDACPDHARHAVRDHTVGPGRGVLFRPGSSTGRRASASPGSGGLLKSPGCRVPEGERRGSGGACRRGGAARDHRVLRPAGHGRGPTANRVRNGGHRTVAGRELARRASDGVCMRFLAFLVAGLLGIYDEQYTADAWPTQAAQLFGIALGGLIAFAACTARLQREVQVQRLSAEAPRSRRPRPATPKAWRGWRSGCNAAC